MAHTIYLDHSASSHPKPEEVYRFMDRALREYGVNPGRGGYQLCREAGDLVERARVSLAAFFNGRRPERLVFSQNSTDALNLAIYGLLQPGDHAVTTRLEHNSVLRPLHHLSQSSGVEVAYVPFDDRGVIDPDDVSSAMKPSTKIVVMTHGSNVIGTVQPVAEVARRCRQRGVTLVVDASQTAGAVPIDVEALGVDVLCFTGHKSMLGPTGIGGMYVRDGVEIRHTRAGGTGVRAAQRSHLDEYPFRMEYGTHNLPGIAGLNAGVEWIRERGIDAIRDHEMALAAMLVTGLERIDGVKVYRQGDPARRLAVVLCNIDGLEAADLGIMLDTNFRIAARTGLHCAPLVHEQLGTLDINGAVRFSIGPFNTDQEIQATLGAMAEIADSQRKRMPGTRR